MTEPKLEIKRDDPLKILASTKRVMERAESVAINAENLDDLAEKIEARLKKGLESPAESFGTSGDWERDVQLIFIEDVVNFCFWEEKGKEKWTVEWEGEEIRGGWYAEEACFERALAEGFPILDAEFIKEISLTDVKHFFRSSNGIEIPLIEKRLENLLEAGRVLASKYQGQFANVIKAAEFDAVKLVQLVTKEFSSFYDVAMLDNETVYFLKRAQIVAFDIGYLNRNNFEHNLKNTDKLTAFADYKIPQMLRMFDVLEYSKDLSKKIDNMELLEAGSREEVEIRSACIWGIELLSQKLEVYSAGEIDNALWLLSQSPDTQQKPYHRAYTIFY